MGRNSKSVFSVLTTNSHSESIRQEEDYYSTDSKAIDYLLDDGQAPLSHKVWECAAGGGSLSQRLIERGYEVLSTDLYDRGYGISGVDFLKTNKTWDGDILSNPPYKIALEFVEHALDIITPGNRVYMFLKIQFLESKKRRPLFDTKQLETVYVSTDRIGCYKNNDFKNLKERSACCYAWFCWRRGYFGNPIIKWIN